MKKLILIILFALISLGIEAQTVVHQKWKGENLTSWGSFYWRVDRSTYPDAYNKYWYYVYFYSNSLLNKDTNGDGKYDKAITYISDINLEMKQYNSYGTYTSRIPLKLDHIICDYSIDKKLYGAYFWSYSPYNKFNITFRKASAWSESKY